MVSVSLRFLLPTVRPPPVFIQIFIVVYPYSILYRIAKRGTTVLNVVPRFCDAEINPSFLSNLHNLIHIVLVRLELDCSACFGE